jgi:LysR family nitrogen assimilation transcriptional regulator
MFENLFSLGGLSIDRLRSFVDVAEKGSIARVANGDPSRQSLISRQIGELEVFFGVELTRRKGKGLEITEAGQELARQVRLQFQSLADFKASCANQPVEYRIASGNSVLEWLVAPQLGRISGVVPGTFSLLDWRTGDIVRGLLDHTVDFGIIRKSALVHPLRFHSLGNLTYRLFVPKGWKDLGGGLAAPLAISIGGEFLEAFERAVAKMKVKPNIVFRCTSFTQAAQLVRSGVATAILPHIASAYVGDAATVKNPAWLKPVTRDLGLAWHQRILEIRPGAESLKSELLKVLPNGLR